MHIRVSLSRSCLLPTCYYARLGWSNTSYNIQITTNNQLSETKKSSANMKINRAKRPREQTTTMKPFTNFVIVMLTLIFISAFWLVISFKPLTKEEQVERFSKLNAEVEPFRKNLSECARQVKASMADVEHFLKRIPQTTMQGKCLVACILKRNAIIKKNKIERDTLINANKAVYGQDEEVMSRLSSAITECTGIVEGIFEICEYASLFNDCMHMKMEHILDKVMMERRMEALGQMGEHSDDWSDEEEEILRLAKDEL